jgi:hypothetical protein
VWNVVFLVVSVPAIYVGGRIAHAPGVAAALLILQILLFVPVYVFLVRPLIGNCAQEYTSAILKPTASALLMALVISLVRTWRNGFPLFAELIMLVALGSILYVLFLLIFNRKAISEFRTILFNTGS